MLDVDTNPLITSVRLRRGVCARSVRIAVATPLHEPDRLAPGDVFDAFLAGIREGFFGRGRVESESRAIQLHCDAGMCIDLLAVRVSRMPPTGFGVLPSMVRSSVPGAKRLEIHEECSDERALLVRALEQDTEATILNVDWEIAMSGEAPHLRVEMASPVDTNASRRLVRVLETWVTLVRLGAFPPADGGLPPGQTAEVGMDDRCATVSTGGLACGYDGFESLFEALDAIHQEHPIERVVIPYRVPMSLDGPHDAVRPPEGRSTVGVDP